MSSTEQEGKRVRLWHVPSPKDPLKDPLKELKERVRVLEKQLADK